MCQGTHFNNNATAYRIIPFVMFDVKLLKLMYSFHVSSTCLASRDTDYTLAIIDCSASSSDTSNKSDFITVCTFNKQQK